MLEGRVSSSLLRASGLSWLCRTVLTYSAAPYKEAPPHVWASSNSHTFTLTTSSSKAGWTAGSYSYIEAPLVFFLSPPTDPNAACTFITSAISPAPCSAGTGCDDSSSPWRATASSETSHHHLWGRQPSPMCTALQTVTCASDTCAWAARTEDQGREVMRRTQHCQNCYHSFEYAGTSVQVPTLWLPTRFGGHTY